MSFYHPVVEKMTKHLDDLKESILFQDSRITLTDS